MITENLSTLHIHKLTQTQYKRLVDEGKDDENALYLTPDETVAPELDNNGVLHFVSNVPDEQGATTDAVLYTEQSLSDEQKAQARENIGAVSDDIIIDNGTTDTITLNNTSPAVELIGEPDYFIKEEYPLYAYHFTELVPKKEHFNECPLIVNYRREHPDHPNDFLEYTMPIYNTRFKEDGSYNTNSMVASGTVYPSFYARLCIVPSDDYVFDEEWPIRGTLPKKGVWIIVDKAWVKPVSLTIWDRNSFPHKHLDRNLISDSIRITAQSLTPTQKAQVRDNIGAVGADIMISGDFSDTIVFDHAIESEVVAFEDDEYGNGFYAKKACHITDWIPAEGNFIDGKLEVIVGVKDGTKVKTATFICDRSYFNDDGFYWTFDYPGDSVKTYLYIVPIDNYVLDDDSWMKFKFPKKGIWISRSDAAFVTITGSNCFENKQINPALLPETILRSEAQTLTETEKAQVRKNIDACEASIVVGFGDTVTWDGDAGSKPSVQLSDKLYVRISDYAPTLEDFPANLDEVRVSLVNYTRDDSELSIKSLDDSSTGVIAPNYGVDPIMFVSVPEDAVGKTVTDIFIDDVIFPASGFYLCRFDDGGYVSSVTIPDFSFEPKMIDPALIPDTVLRSEAQTLTEEQKAQARKNIGADFSYDFATVNKASTRASDYDALKYIETNWSKEPMNLSVQGFPVVKVDITNKRFCTFYTDKAMHVFKWETDDSKKASKVTWVSKSTLADTNYVDEQIGNIESVLNSIISIQEALVCGYQVTEVETSLDSIIDTQNSLIGGENE